MNPDHASDKCAFQATSASGRIAGPRRLSCPFNIKSVSRGLEAEPPLRVIVPAAPLYHLAPMRGTTAACVHSPISSARSTVAVMN
jgi:hypothetical protein